MGYKKTDKDDRAWGYGTRVTYTGTFGIMCNFCKKIITGGGINRFKYHLAGIKGHKTAPCKNVPKTVRGEMVDLLTEPGLEVNAASTSPSTKTHKRKISDNYLDTDVVEALLGNKGTESERINRNSDNADLDDEMPHCKLRKNNSKSPKNLPSKEKEDSQVEPISISKKHKTYEKKKNLKLSFEPCSSVRSNSRCTRSSSTKKACVNANKSHTDLTCIMCSAFHKKNSAFLKYCILLHYVVDKSEHEGPNKEMQHRSRCSMDLDEKADVDPISNNQQEYEVGTEPDLIENDPLIEPNPNLDTNLTLVLILNPDGPLIGPNPNYNSNPGDPSIEPNPHYNTNPNGSSTEPNPNSNTNPNGYSIEPNPNSNSSPNEPSIEPNLNYNSNPSWFSLSEDSPIKMTNSMWQYLKGLKLSKWTPQRPHFKTLQSDWPEIREGKALGMIITYVNLKHYMKNLSFDDDVASFRDKIKYLDTLQENGFNVDSMRSHLKKLLEIKCKNASRLILVEEQEMELSRRKTDDDKGHMMLDQFGTGLKGFKRRGCELTGERNRFEEERESLSNLMAQNRCEILRMKNEISNVGSYFEKFTRILDEFVRV